MNIKSYETALDLGDIGDHEALVDGSVEVTDPDYKYMVELHKVTVRIQMMPLAEYVAVTVLDRSRGIDLISDFAIEDLKDELVEHYVKTRGDKVG